MLLRKVIREARKRQYNNLISSDNKTTWNIVKNESGKVCCIEHVQLLFQYDNIHIYSDQAAEAFNKYFLAL